MINKFLILILFPISCFSQSFKQSTNLDKHFYAGAIVGISTSFIYYGTDHKSKLTGVALSTASATLAGIVKEEYDIRNGGIGDMNDVLVTGLGGLVGGLLSSYTLGNYNSHSQIKIIIK